MRQIEDLGAFFFLASFADYYQPMPLDLLSVMFQEPILLGQYKVYETEEGAPVAAVTWATLTDEVSEKFAEGNYTPQPGEWDAGDNFWFIDFMAPFGGAKSIVSDLRHNFFNSPEFVRWQTARSIRPDGRIMTWRQPQAKEEA